MSRYVGGVKQQMGEAVNAAMDGSIFVRGWGGGGGGF
jgi:hypothetical protein